MRYNTHTHTKVPAQQSPSLMVADGTATDIHAHSSLGSAARTERARARSPESMQLVERKRELRKNALKGVAF